MRRVPLAVLLAFASTAGLGQDGVRVETYPVTGSTYGELIASMRRAGPVAGDRGRRHYGITEVGFRPNWTVRPGPDGCELVRAEVRASIRVVLPRWHERYRATPALQERWARLRDDIERHENHHAAIAREWHARMIQRLNEPARARSCARLNALMESKAREVLAAHRAAQLAFDGIGG